MVAGSSVDNPDYAAPDYAALVRYLIEPFMEAPQSLRIHTEQSPSTARLWIRVAFDGEDKGRVFGRHGRNIQAVRTVLTAAAQSAGQLIHLDIYGERDQRNDSRINDTDRSSRRPRRPSRPSNSHPRRQS